MQPDAAKLLWHSVQLADSMKDCWLLGPNQNAAFVKATHHLQAQAQKTDCEERRRNSGLPSFRRLPEAAHLHGHVAHMTRGPPWRVKAAVISSGCEVGSSVSVLKQWRK